jgi:trans-aconitate methyltransferase
MERVPEAELMDDDAQARAYAEADFEEPHSRFVALFQQQFPGEDIAGYVLDLGCGPADITVRFARAYPRATVHGVDGAASMLKYGRKAVARHALTGRIELYHAYLPGAATPRARYQCLISNSLLHHLADPQVLWETVRERAEPGAAVFVMDLARPRSEGEAWALVQHYSGAEPEILQRDFFNSLCAAYVPTEVREQLTRAGLTGLSVRRVSDRHLVVAGRA